MKKNRWIWFVLFILITALTIWTIVSQCSSFDMNELLDDLKKSNKIWLALAILAVFSNLFFEAIVLKEIIKVICPEFTGKGRYLLYSSADHYFSAITPFTSGGQPAVVYIMLKDKLSGAGITISLILDYIACTITNLLAFFVGLIVLSEFAIELSALSITLVIFGGVLLVLINIALFFLLFNTTLFRKIAVGLFNFFNKIFHFKNVEQRMDKLNNTIEDYKQCSLIMKQNKKMVFKAFLFTIFQKLGRTLATVFVFFAVMHEYEGGFRVWFVQVMSELGASFVPIPGGIGAREYILIDGFSKLSFIDNAANLGLVCEAVSFYLSIIISGLIVLYNLIQSKIKDKKAKTLIDE